MKTYTKVNYPKRLHIVAMMANGVAPKPALVTQYDKHGGIDTYPIYAQTQGTRHG